jgi:hypothetical protein
MHIFATIAGVSPSDYHDHKPVYARGLNDPPQVIEIEFLSPSSRSNDVVTVQMYLIREGDASDSKIEERNPVINSDLTPNLVVKASNVIFNDNSWGSTQPVTSTSSFELTYNNPFYINLYLSTGTIKYTVSVRQNISSITNTRTFYYNPTYGNPTFTSNENIAGIFISPYFTNSYKRNHYTVFVQARDCQGNIIDSKNFDVFYTGIKLFEQAPDLDRW